jgi:hypothetical protein
MAQMQRDRVIRAPGPVGRHQRGAWSADSHHVDIPRQWRWQGRHAAPDPAEDGATPGQRPVEPSRLTPVGHLVRPYMRTRGRTCAGTAFELETMISLPVPRRNPVEPEHREIGALCAARPRSVAELAAFTALPLGVTRVLVADMADQGLVLVDPGTTRRAPGEPPARSVMERVLHGLRRL